jgi:hypothetical protein
MVVSVGWAVAVGGDLVVGVDVGVDVGVEVGVGGCREEVAAAVVGGIDVKSPALAGLTLNCRIGQKIKVMIRSKIDEEVRTTPRENLE